MEIQPVIDLEAEKKEILKRYKDLLRACKRTLEKGDKLLIRKAFDIALEAHKDMRRKSGEPYIYHPIAVAHICAEEIGLGTTSVVCALLHDVMTSAFRLVKRKQKLLMVLLKYPVYLTKAPLYRQRTFVRCYLPYRMMYV
jgi:hypothetical protein